MLPGVSAIATISLHMKKDGGMWMVGEWLSAMSTCLRVVLILVLCAETPDSGLPGAADTASYNHIA